MEKKSFLNYERPLLTSMVQAPTIERIKELITLSRGEGAEAFGMQFSTIVPQSRNPQTYRELFSFAELPVYVTNYRSRGNTGKSDEILAEELLEIADCGATLCDVMGDYFDPCVGELTRNEKAIQKQMKLIDELHNRGAEVLMSSHVHQVMTAEQVLEMALEQERRGADICKIVVKATTMEEQIENLRAFCLLKENLKASFLFLSGGVSHLVRRLGGTLGNCMTLCVYEHDEHATKAQPLLRDMKNIRDYMEEPKHEI